MAKRPPRDVVETSETMHQVLSGVTQKWYVLKIIRKNYSNFEKPAFLQYNLCYLTLKFQNVKRKFSVLKILKQIFQSYRKLPCSNMETVL